MAIGVQVSLSLTARATIAAAIDTKHDVLQVTLLEFIRPMIPCRIDRCVWTAGEFPSNFEQSAIFSFSDIFANANGILYPPGDFALDVMVSVLAIAMWRIVRFYHV